MNISTRFPLVAALLAATILAAGCASDAPAPSGPRNVTVSALRAESEAVPGKSLTLAWRFEMADGWHLYGDARNDSGLPPAVELDLPEGWTADPVLWPGTVRHESPGDILDHVYEDELVLLQRVVVGPHAEYMTDAEFSARISWLACREACVPGDTTLTVTVPVRAHASPTLDSPRISRLRGALPRPPAPGEVVTSREDGALRITAPGAVRIEFHPAADCAPLADALGDGAAEGDVLELGLRPDPQELPVRGILRITAGDGIVSYLKLNVPSEGDGS